MNPNADPKPAFTNRGANTPFVDLSNVFLPPSKPHCEYCGEEFTPETPGDTMCSWSCVEAHAYEQTGE